MNPWLFSFFISFIIFLALIDWKHISTNIYGGILSAIYMFIDVFLANILGLFKYNGVNWGLPKFILFSDLTNIFFVGISFNIGVILLQLLPQKLGFQFIYAFIWTLFLLLFLFILKEFSLVTYIHFKVHFVIRYLLFFLCLAWFKTFYLQRKKVAMLTRW